MPPILDPSADIAHDHGTPQWRARHAAQITIYKSRRDAWRELMRQQPLIGRVLVNGWPTGVEVAHAMVHGGPYPSTSDSRATSVGSLAIRRFLRPVCYQDLPAALLPEALRDANPLGLWRRIGGVLGRD